MAFSGSQTTALSVMAYPGQPHTFSAKEEFLIVFSVGPIVRAVEEMIPQVGIEELIPAVSGVEHLTPEIKDVQEL